MNYVMENQLELCRYGKVKLVTLTGDRGERLWWTMELGDFKER